MTTAPPFWLAVAAIFAVNGLLSWAWGASALALAQVTTAGLAAVAGATTWRVRAVARRRLRDPR